MLQGHVDFALLYAPLPETFRTVPLMEERVFVAVPRHHPLVSQYNEVQPLPYPAISFKAFQDEPFIILKPSRCMRTIYDNLCQTTGVKPKVVFEGDSILSAAEAPVQSRPGIFAVHTVIQAFPSGKAFLFSIAFPHPIENFNKPYKKDVFYHSQ